MIECRNLRYVYSPDTGISDFSAVISESMITCIMGKNGAGKTTLLNMLCGLKEPQSGNVLFNGKDLWQKNNFCLLKTELSILPSSPFLFSALTLRDNYAYISRIRYNDRNHWNTLVPFIQQLEMEQYLDSKPEELSYGQNRKAHIIASMISEAHYIIWDEPHNGIDLISNEAISEMLVSFRNKGAAVVLTTHVTELAEKLSDRILILDRSELKADLAKTQIQETGLYQLYTDIIRKE